MARIVITGPADADTAEILETLYLRSGHRTAVKYITAFERLYERLADHPLSGSLRPAIAQDVRIALVPPFVVIYRFFAADDTLAILGVVHGRRKIDAGLLQSRR